MFRPTGFRPSQPATSKPLESRRSVPRKTSALRRRESDPDHRSSRPICYLRDPRHPEDVVTGQTIGGGEHIRLSVVNVPEATAGGRDPESAVATAQYRGRGQRLHAGRWRMHNSDVARSRIVQDRRACPRAARYSPHAFSGHQLLCGGFAQPHAGAKPAAGEDWLSGTPAETRQAGAPAEQGRECRALEPAEPLNEI